MKDTGAFFLLRSVWWLVGVRAALVESQKEARKIRLLGERMRVAIAPTLQGGQARE